MKRPRLALVFGLLAGLVVLEVVHAVRRFRLAAERSVDTRLADLRGELVRQAARLEDGLALGQRYARYLADLDSIVALPGSGAAGVLDRASRDASAVLHHFASFGGITVLDINGNERLRVERMGGGVATVPEALLREKADPARAAAAAALAAGQVLVSPLEIDSARVDVTEQDRRVVRYTAPVLGKARGVLVLSVYATPLFQHLRGLEPIPGAVVFMLDDEGRYLLAPRAAGGVDASSAQRPANNWSAARSFSDDEPEASLKMAAGGESAVRSESMTFVNVPVAVVAGGRPWRIVARIADKDLDTAAIAFRDEALSVGALFAVTLVAIAIVGVVIVKLDAEQRRVQGERHAERKLAETERLAALGRLTAGVAHEINNPLAGIRNYLALLSREEKSPERRREYIDLVTHGLERIGTIVRDLLSFAKPPTPARVAVDIADVLDRVERVTRHDAGFREIRWERDVKPDCPKLFADPFALEQVFLNLALNARDALQRASGAEARARGEICVKAGHRFGGSDCVEVIFEDTGAGIPLDVLPNIFKPFFTTRVNGTGLGLSVSASLIDAHGGSIRAENRAEGGARFVIELPAVKLQPTSPLANP